MSQYVAERKLNYAEKGGGVRKEVSIRIGQPYLVEEGSVNFTVDEDTAGCIVVIDGLPEEVLETYYGADLLQALQLAADIEPLIQRFSKKYDFFFPSGEPYFEGEEENT